MPADDNGEFPGPVQFRVDVHVALLDAITDRTVWARDEILPDWAASEKDVAEVAWALCLTTFERRLEELDPIYAFYVHRPIYTAETHTTAFTDTVTYLMAKIRGQLDGAEA